MKNISFFLFLFVSFSLLGQSPIPNGNFESWTTTQFLDLDDFVTPARESEIAFGVPATFRSTDRVSGAYSVRMETSIYGADTVFGFITTGEFMQSNGFAFNQQPDSIIGYYKSDIKPGDTALMIVNFSALGNQFSTETYTFVGTQSTWQKFSFPISISQTPDSAFIAVASSNALSGVGMQDGSWLMLDSIAFAGAVSMQSIPNFDFENWTADTAISLDSWTESEAASRTTDNQEGNFAVELETKLVDGDTAFILTNGRIQNGAIVGGNPFTFANDTLVGFFKYIPSGGGDTAAMSLNLLKNGSIIDQYFKLFTSQATYTTFEVPFVASQVPDSMFLVVASSIDGSNLGSKLYLDDLRLKSIVTSLDKVINTIGEVMLYPNPVADYLTIEIEKSEAQIQVQIVDALGRNFTTSQVKNGQQQIRMDVSDLKRGTYFLRLETNGEFIYRSFIKQ